MSGDTALGVPCDPAAPDALCYMWKLAETCYPFGTSPPDPPIPAQITLFGLVEHGYFVGHEISIQSYCGDY